ncbi:acyl-CoA dehydrogenase family protein [Sphingomonas prati]|uniref:Alkylation response protein AidB-like acyl-CoA dehydrogenase n=1 Tax=Sphingomonas prati TaxID=1843237 RepID=A0A7W9BTG2_9SPHN|nr:acyl-CoA dehydrogenase family protein [Sphingomonas prati]MBB5729824.1 alkylation response protein AidB-like acyl-CoA dehydrogenase [Sphingomonas prati]GGE89238.1 pimeloyl-CoA dehydrogenase large subunit [Sphingomonas prati]
MNLDFDADELAFRDEVRAFLAAELPDDIRTAVADRTDLTKEQIVRWHGILHRRGWAVPKWAAEHGGRGWTPAQKYIFQEELSLARAPDEFSFNVAMIGPVIARFGTDAQKERFLPPTASLDIWWCQGFSEPGSGSDLASLKTTAVRDGDDYVVNGQKIWTTLAQHADWIFALVRTDPNAQKPQMGISFLLIDMTTPGITVRPIRTIDNHHEVNEVFFDDVRVPAENLIGQENKGWDYAKHLLGNERSGIARIGLSKERLRWARATAKEMAADGRMTQREHARLLRELIETEIDLKALELTQLRVVAADSAGGGGDPGAGAAASSILKVKGSDIQQRMTEIMMTLAGPAGLAQPDLDHGRNEEPQDRWLPAAAPYYFTMRKVSIYGGSNEIQRNIVAKTVMGL